MACRCCGWNNPLNEPIRIGLPMCGCEYGWCDRCKKCPKHCTHVREELLQRIRECIENNDIKPLGIDRDK